ncbi:MAG TPA: glycosyltransferase [Gemmatimonas sp.]|nr:glycosyltransferase [Gemmatimonas sp.]
MSTSVGTVPAIVVLVAGLLIAWIVVGYPVVVLALARLRPGRPIAKAAITPRVDVVVPVRNGAKWLAQKLASIRSQDYPAHLVRVIVVSDGSTDETTAIVRDAAAVSGNVVLLELPPGGKATALNEAFHASSADVLVLTDVRQTLDASCIRMLVQSFADPAVGVVSGELRIGSAGDEEAVSLYWRLETRLRHALSSLDSMLGATGPIYALRRELFRTVPPGTILDDMYLPLAAFFQGFRLVSEPRAVAWDEPMDLKTEFGRKVRTMAGGYQLMRLERRLLSPRRNRMFSHYLSYKLGRLLLPHLFLVMFLASWFVPQPHRTMLVDFQCLVYLLALVDPMLPAAFPLSRLTRPLRAFGALVIAAFVAQKIFFVRAESIWVPTRSR